MDEREDAARIAAQEEALVFEAFDENAAFAIGGALREQARADGVSLVVDIRLWDRALFFSALPGTTADNAEWVRRKANVVRLLHKSSYRVVMERPFPEKIFPDYRALDVKDFAMAGGGFPIRVRGVGVVGAIVVSGLPEREDHARVVEAICQYLGKDYAGLALPAQ